MTKHPHATYHLHTSALLMNTRPHKRIHMASEACKACRRHTPKIMSILARTLYRRLCRDLAQKLQEAGELSVAHCTSLVYVQSQLGRHINMGLMHETSPGIV